MSDALVVADIGNSALKVLVFAKQGDELFATSVRFDDGDLTLPQILVETDTVVAVSVNAAHLARVETLRGKPVTLVGRDLPIPIENATEFPEQSGEDRLCAALGSWNLRPMAQVVVGCGTAITVDVVDAEGRFLGGAIAPGIHAALDGLVTAAPLLPRVDPWEEPATFPAGGTAEAIRVAARLGFAGLVERLVGEARRALGDLGAPVVLSGGDAGRLAALLRIDGVTVRPYLVAEGVRDAWVRHEGR